MTPEQETLAEILKWVNGLSPSRTRMKLANALGRVLSYSQSKQWPKALANLQLARLQVAVLGTLGLIPSVDHDAYTQVIVSLEGTLAAYAQSSSSIT